MRTEIADLERSLRYFADRSKIAGCALHDLKAALKERRAHELIRMPRWALEVLSAHARKRYENITPEHRTDRYKRALGFAAGVVDKIWPRDIKGEWHGSTSIGGCRFDKE
ncbi:MAG: hypothetical protein V3T08_09940 [Gemmatimonadota bacterium]